MLIKNAIQTNLPKKISQVIQLNYLSFSIYQKHMMIT